MEKIKFKFALSLIMLLNIVLVSIFFRQYLEDLETIFFPVLFVYFFIDTIVMFSPYFNEATFSGKQFFTLFNKINGYSKEKLNTAVHVSNKKALFTFLVYFSGIGLIILLYHTLPFQTPLFIYITFFAINAADYFCILIWCPFRTLIFKNSCCTTCRISNWDRLMKFFILLAIPNVYTISIFIMAFTLFLLWEYQHFKYPERFYRISNKTLHCSKCKESNCRALKA